MLINVATRAIDLRLRRLLGLSFDELFNCFFGFELIFGGFPFGVIVARFNFDKNSSVTNVGSFNNGIYVPSSKKKKQTTSFFLFIRKIFHHRFVLIHNDNEMENDVFQMKQIWNRLKKDEMVLHYLLNINLI